MELFRVLYRMSSGGEWRVLNTNSNGYTHTYTSRASAERAIRHAFRTHNETRIQRVVVDWQDA